MQASQIETQFMAVYEEHADAIFRHCYFRVFNREQARDLMQEAFTKTWAEISTGREVRNIKAFVYKVATNLIIDESRKKSESSLDSLHEEKGFDPAVEGSTMMKNQVDSELIITLAKQLDPDSREVLLLRYVDNLAPREIAEIIGESTNVISVRIHRAVKEIQKLLDL